jgi:hypothetical protein
MMIIYVYTVYLSARYIHSKPAHVKIYMLQVILIVERRSVKVLLQRIPSLFVNFFSKCWWAALVEIVIIPAKDNLEEKK